jgi:N-acyl-D-amino-acid deacylase
MACDTGAITLEQAHYHLSYMPAWTAGFQGPRLHSRRNGRLMVYDLAKLAIKEPEGAYDVPPNNDSRLVQRPEGYRWIMVNGRVTFENGDGTGAFPGVLVHAA